MPFPEISPINNDVWEGWNLKHIHNTRCTKYQCNTQYHAA